MPYQQEKINSLNTFLTLSQPVHYPRTHRFLLCFPRPTTTWTEKEKVLYGSFHAFAARRRASLHAVDRLKVSRRTQMLIARAPMRISLGGGGTDLKAYYAKYGGTVINASINKYFYTIITPDNSNVLQVISADYRTLFRHPAYHDLFWNGDLALLKAVLHEDRKS